MKMIGDRMIEGLKTSTKDAWVVSLANEKGIGIVTDNCLLDDHSELRWLRFLLPQSKCKFSPSDPYRWLEGSCRGLLFHHRIPHEKAFLIRLVEDILIPSGKKRWLHSLWGLRRDCLARVLGMTGKVPRKRGQPHENARCSLKASSDGLSHWLRVGIPFYPTSLPVWGVFEFYHPLFLSSSPWIPCIGYWSSFFDNVHDLGSISLSLSYSLTEVFPILCGGLIMGSGLAEGGKMIGPKDGATDCANMDTIRLRWRSKSSWGGVPANHLWRESKLDQGSTHKQVIVEVSRDLRGNSINRVPRSLPWRESFGREGERGFRHDQVKSNHRFLGVDSKGRIPSYSILELALAIHPETTSEITFV
ncbi:hypothetical protein Tco_0944937 [Tanacetum coccineum]